ncbi:MAG: flippase-like domain-containing protein, partial [Chloroflexota bacterium]|nr:flippase-like domain-containing protein [Chloroflexota bacterium]
YVLNKQQGIKKTTSLATIFVERVFDGLTMVGFAAAVVLFLVTVDRNALSTGNEHKLGSLITQLSVPIAVASIAFLGLLIVFVAVASSRQRVERLVSFGLRFLPGRLHERGEKLAGAFVDGLSSLRSASSLAIVFGTSVVAWLLETGMYYLIGNFGFNLTAKGSPLPFYVYMLVTALVNLSTLIPQAPGFLGLFDWVGKVVLVGAFAVESGAAISYVFLLHAALLIPVSLLGFFYLAKESLSWGELTSLEKNRAHAAESVHEHEGPLTDIEQADDDRESS